MSFLQRWFGAPKTVPAPEQRTIEPGGTGPLVTYELRRSARRRSVALQVDERGVRVAAPATMPLARIETFIHGHAAWLLERLARATEQAARQRLDVVDGAHVPLLGRPVRIRMQQQGRTHWRQTDDGAQELWLGPGEPAARLEGALRRHALDWYRQRVDVYCHRLGVAVPAVRLTAARTRWGSCSTRSGIRLHWRLIHLRPELIDYVVAHEVAHLVEMNHSPRFWAVVERLYPDWRAARDALRTEAACLPRIAPRDTVGLMAEQGEDDDETAAHHAARGRS